MTRSRSRSPSSTTTPYSRSAWWACCRPWTASRSSPRSAPPSEARPAARPRRRCRDLMDLHLGDASGIDVTRRLLAARPELKVLVITMREDDDAVVASVRAGARGYLLKAAAPDEVERAIRAVANGEMILGPAVAERAMSYLLSGRGFTKLPLPELTDREREVTRPRRPRTRQRRDQPATVAQPEDRPQPRRQHLDQARPSPIGPPPSCAPAKKGSASTERPPGRTAAGRAGLESWTPSKRRCGRSTAAVSCATSTARRPTSMRRCRSGTPRPTPNHGPSRRCSGCSTSSLASASSMSGRFGMDHCAAGPPHRARRRGHRRRART